jgi:hypothetical protein
VPCHYCFQPNEKVSCNLIEFNPCLIKNPVSSRLPTRSILGISTYTIHDEEQNCYLVANFSTITWWNKICVSISANSWKLAQAFNRVNSEVMGRSLHFQVKHHVRIKFATPMLHAIDNFKNYDIFPIYT